MHRVEKARQQCVQTKRHERPTFWRAQHAENHLIYSLRVIAFNYSHHLHIYISSFTLYCSFIPFIAENIIPKKKMGEK